MSFRLRLLLLALSSLLIFTGCPKQDEPNNSATPTEGTGTGEVAPVNSTPATGGECDATCAVVDDLKAALGEGEHKLVDVLGALVSADTPNVDAMLIYIQRASTAERQAALGDAALMAKLKALSGDKGTLVMSTLLTGSQRWVNPPRNDFYDHFVNRGQDAALGTAATMNCWESVLYAALLSGDINGDYIRQFYANAFKHTDPNVGIWSQLGWRADLPVLSDTNQPQPGDMIFYTDPRWPQYPGHIAIYLGDGNVVSLWNQPRGIDEVQIIKIDDLSGTIQYTRPPWSTP